ncbi:MAG: CHAT domain-containing protein [Minicystis sp.]
MKIRPGEVEATCPEAGGGMAALVLPFEAAACRDALQGLGVPTRNVRPVAPAKAPASLEELGAKLFEAVFTGDVRSAFDRAMGAAGAEKRGLRIRIEAEGALGSMPWEILYDPTIQNFPCLMDRTPCVRNAVVLQPIEPLSVAPPLRVLGVAASPRGLAPLDVAAERRNIETATRDLDRVSLTWLGDPSPEQLHAAMENGRFHVLHFAGHGGVDEQGNGFICLPDGDGVARISDRDLGQLLDRDLRLVVLNACQGAAAGDVGPQDGSDHAGASLATRLLAQGVPAVLAMQFPISDGAAIELSRSFYGALAQGRPIDVALTEARRGIRFHDRGHAEWATPVLYMRTADGQLFAPVRRRRAPWLALPAALLVVGAIPAAHYLHATPPPAPAPPPSPGLSIRVGGLAAQALGPNDERYEEIHLDPAADPASACKGLTYCLQVPGLGYLPVPGNGLSVAPPTGPARFVVDAGRPAFVHNLRFDAAKARLDERVLLKRKGAEYHACKSGRVTCSPEGGGYSCVVLDEEPCF